MPIKSNSIDVVTSFIGLGSTGEGMIGIVKAASEVYRILKNDGIFIAIENEWVDFNQIIEVFKKWDKEVWTGLNMDKTWSDIFLDTGFTIESCEKTNYRKISKEDNELGEQASRLGIDIELKYNLFILRKCNKNNKDL